MIFRQPSRSIAAIPDNETTAAIMDQCFEVSRERNIHRMEKEMKNCSAGVSRTPRRTMRNKYPPGREAMSTIHDAEHHPGGHK
jgi:hypothetical protein